MQGKLATTFLRLTNFLKNIRFFCDAKNKSLYLYVNKKKDDTGVL